MRISNKILAILAVVIGALAFVSPAKADLTYTFTSGSGIAVTGSNYAASGALNLTLGFAPTPGTNLTVVNNTGLPFISGTFDGVRQGGTVTLNFNGAAYPFIANYFGGNGRSLVLQWPCLGLSAWGSDYYGTLGNGSRTQSLVPVTVNTGGALAGKTVVAIAAGSAHSLALTSDGQVFAWGYNSDGELGNSGTTDSLVPIAVNTSGALTGKTVVAIAAGSAHSLALTSDGQVFAWGYNGVGQLGNSGTANSLEPVAVSNSGALTGKTVVAIASGGFHSLALTSDGQVFAWGYNCYGQLGNSSTTDSLVPVAVNTSGALAGKTVIAVDAGNFHSMALTSDKQVLSWGYNYWGQLGDNSTTDRRAPVAVNTSGALMGKTVVAISAGGAHSLALTSDSQIFSWGYNYSGQLGNNSTTASSVPVAVNTSGALTGKTVVAVTAGNSHCTALTSDNQVFSWGSDSSGQLGNNSTTNSSVPVAVNTSDALANRTVTTIVAGYDHSLVMVCLGPPTVIGNPWSHTVVSGSSTWFQASVVYDSTTTPTVQWQVSTTGTSGEFSNIDSVSNPTAITAMLTLNNVTLAQNGYAYRAVFTNSAGSSTTTAATLTVSSPPSITANPSSQVVISGSTGTFTAAANGDPAPAVQWRVSTTGTGGVFSNVVGNPTATTGTLTLTNVTLAQNGYAYRAVFTNITGTCTTAAAGLTVLAPPSVATNPANQMAKVGDTAAFTATAAISNPVPTVQWQVSTTGTGGVFNNIVGNPTATTGTLTLTNVSQAQNGYAYRAVFTNMVGSCTTAVATLTIVKVNVQDLLATFTSGTNVPLTKNDYVYVSGSLRVVLGFAPAPGTNLTVINNNGQGFIGGTFSNVPQGGTVFLTYNGVTYNYIANYYGRNGRSLVLEWPCTALVAWGYNGEGELGNNSTLNSLLPVAVTTTGALAGKSVVTIAGGGSCGAHSLALTSDGQVFAWGFNYQGQLGNNSTTSSSIPVAVSTSGALAGKTVVAIAGGAYHSLALTSDGQVFAWGANYDGELGNNSTTNSSVPVAVNVSGALAGKTVVAIAAGGEHSMALTSDGQVFAWGGNYYGELGNNSTTNSSVPVAVNTGGVLAGKTVTAIAAGSEHSMVLTSDGQVFAWGGNYYGELGNNSTTNSSVPVAVNTDGVLSGKAVVAIAASDESFLAHSLALTSDGQVFAWGHNYYGELGNNSRTDSSVPVAVSTTGVMAGKTAVAIAAGGDHSLALTSDGQVFAWGYNFAGQLGNNSTTDSSVPVAVSASGQLAGKTVTAIAAGYYHTLAMFGSGAPSVTVNPVSQTVTSGATVSLVAAATDNPAPAVQWQVSTTGLGGTFVTLGGNPSATTGTLVLANVTSAQNSYAYRAVFRNNAGSCTTTAATINACPPPTLTLPPNITVDATCKNGAAVLYNVTANGRIDGALTPVCSPPSGSNFPIGTTTVNCSVTDSLGGTANASFTVTVQRAYAGFQDQYGLLNTTPAADPFRTGVCNLAAYAFGVNPAAPDRSQLPSVGLQNGYLQISYPRWKDAADVMYVVEVSGDLQHWDSGPGYTQQVSVCPINGDSTREQVIVRDLKPTSDTSSRFIRVRLTH